MASKRQRRAARAALTETQLRMLSHQVEQSRRELGETVRALAMKQAEAADNKALLRAARRSLAVGARLWNDTAHGRRRRAYTRTAAIVAPAAALAAVAVLWQVRRNNHR